MVGNNSIRSGVLLRLVAAGALSLILSIALAATAWQSEARLGAPEYWAWLLTGLQVAAMWFAGSGRSQGWLLGAAVQPAWITYALLTGQIRIHPRLRPVGGCTGLRLPAESMDADC